MNNLIYGYIIFILITRLNKKKRKSSVFDFKMDIITMIKKQQNSIRKNTPRLSTTLKIHPLINNTGEDITYHEKFWNFILAPRSHFVYETLLYIAFLVTFSYLMLCEYRFYVPKNKKFNLNRTNLNYSNNSSNHLMIGHKDIRPQAIPHWLEYLIIYWVLTFCCQEVFQV